MQSLKFYFADAGGKEVTSSIADEYKQNFFL